MGSKWISLLIPMHLNLRIIAGAAQRKKRGQQMNFTTHSNEPGCNWRYEIPGILDLTVGVTLPEPMGLLINWRCPGNLHITIWVHWVAADRRIHFVHNDGFSDAFYFWINKYLKEIIAKFLMSLGFTFRSCKMALCRKVSTFSSRLEIMARHPAAQS